MFMRTLFLGLTVISLAGCSMYSVANVASQFGSSATHLFKRGTAAAGLHGRNCTNGEGPNKIGNTYKIDGLSYTPISNSTGYKKKGIASWYGSDFHGKPTANGECYNMYAYTAAHKTLPIPTIVRVTNLENKKSVVLRVNDRGPFVKSREIDLSYSAAKALGMDRKGTAPVIVEAIGGAFHSKEKPKSLFSRWAKEDLLKVQKRTTNAVKRAVDKVRTPSRGSSFTHRVSGRQAAVEPQKLAQIEPAAGTLPAQTATITEEALQPVKKDVEKLIVSTNISKTDVTEKLVEEAVNQALQEDPAAKLVPAPEQAENIAPPPLEVPQASDEKLTVAKVFVQTGAYGSKSNAERQVTLLQETYKNTAIQELQRGETTLHRVRVGPFESIKAADDAMQKLSDAGFSNAVIAVD